MEDIRCPYCNTSLIGENTMARESEIQCMDWFGIKGCKITDCNDYTTSEQIMAGEIYCVNCKEYIDEFITNLINENKLDDTDVDLE